MYGEIRFQPPRAAKICFHLCVFKNCPIFLQADKEGGIRNQWGCRAQSDHICRAGYIYETPFGKNCLQISLVFLKKLFKMTAFFSLQ